MSNQLKWASDYLKNKIHETRQTVEKVSDLQIITPKRSYLYFGHSS